MKTLVSVLMATALAGCASSSIDVWLWSMDDRIQPRLDPHALVANVPCGNIEQHWLESMPPDTAIPGADSIVEYLQDGTVVRTWRVPADAQIIDAGESAITVNAFDRYYTIEATGRLRASTLTAQQGRDVECPQDFGPALREAACRAYSSASTTRYFANRRECT